MIFNLRSLMLLLSLACVCLQTSALAQTADQEARAEIWNAYQLPAAEFVRFVDRKQGYSLWRPAGWSESADGLVTFSGGETWPQVRVLTTQVPDGYSAANFATSLLQQWRNQPIRQETVVVRRVLVGGADGREFTFEIEEEPGHTLRQTVWLTTVGTRAYLFYFLTEPEEQEKYEPYFKRMMLSLRIGAAGHWTEEFETLRARFAAAARPQAGREIEAAQLAESLRAGREPAEAVTGRLTALLREAPPAALDLLTDYDPQVRAAAIAAIGKTEDARMIEVLVWALSDKDGYASALAARALAGRGAAGLAALKGKLTTLSKEPGAVLRVAALLTEEEARELAQQLLKNDEAASQLAGLQLALALPLKGFVLPVQKLLASDSPDVALATLAALRVRHAAEALPELQRLLTSSEAEHRAVRALGEIAPAEVAGRFQERIKEIDARLMSIRKSESWPPPTARGRGKRTLSAPPAPRSTGGPRPVVTPVTGVATAAARNEEYESEVSAYRELVSAVWLPLPEFKALPESVRLAVLRGELVIAAEKIELRARFARAADLSARRAIYEEALRRPDLNGWARLVLRPLSEPDTPFVMDTSGLVDAPPTGETLFPQAATLYLVAPNLNVTLAKLDEALAGVQMEGVRDQMTFALILKSLKARLARAVNAEALSDAATALGVDLKSPLSLATWPASEDEVDGPSRSAVLLRVTDRARFERMLMLYQKEVGGFHSFAVTASAGARFMEAFPAALALALAGDGLRAVGASRAPGLAAPRSQSPVYIRQEKLGDLPLTVFEKLNLYNSGAAGREAIYLAYLGSTAILAPTRAALVDLLKTAEKRTSIKENKAYARALAEEGEIKFFSQPAALLRDSATTKAQADSLWRKLTDALGQETGALRLSSSTWETIFHLELADRGLTHSLLAFKAQELSAPGELLPADTIFYAGAKFDPPKMWNALKGMGLVSARNSLDDVEVEKRVAPKLQGEAALALISLAPAPARGGAVPAFLIALKLKDAELATLHRAGQLFTKAIQVPGVTALSSPVASVADGNGRLYLAVTNGYLLMATDVEALKRLAAKERLSATRDYKRSVSATTESLSLFATYSPDAAFKDVRGAAKDGAEQMAWAALTALVHAFHSQRAIVSVNGSMLEGKLAVSFDREGRFSVGDIAREAREFDVANALITPRGLNIAEPKRTASLRLRVTAKQPGVLARVRDDVAKFPWQKIESADDAGVVFSVEARRIPEKQTVQLPLTGSAELAPYLRSTMRIDRSAPQVVKLAREIAGNDRDGRSVARKLGEWTFKNLKWKKVESSNVETLASREADCLEHSELYVAMARSLGLPARVVTGAAFAGGSFGAHAWVEIYLGRWVEVDPTWGMMDYVDSTHLRFDGDTFASYAMLNQLQLEVLEARSFVADFQRDPTRLVKEWGAAGEDGTHAFVFDFALTAEQALGSEVLRKLTDRQSAAVIQAFERAAASEAEDWSWGARVRVLANESRDGRARLLVLRGDDLLRVDLALRDGGWFITEIEDTDYGIPVFADALRSALRPGTSSLQTLFLTPDNALKQLARIAKTEGESPQLLLMKAMALRRKQYDEWLKRADTEGDKEKEKRPSQESEAAILLRQITTRWPDFAPAQYALAIQLLSYDEEPEKAIEPLRRFASMMPLDPRPWTRMGEAFEQLRRFGEAEVAYREAAARDRDNYESRITLAAFYFKQAQAAKAADSLAQALKLAPDADSAFDSLTCDLLGIDVEGDREGHSRLEELLLAFRKELAQSRHGLRRLAHAQAEQQKYDAALQTLQRVVTLGAEVWDYTLIARTNRFARRPALALGAADQAVKLDGEYAEAHFERACALAQLGRMPEAIVALERALELDPELGESLDSNDWKLVESLPEFKKRLEEKSAEEGDAPQKEKTGDVSAPRN